MLQLSPVHESSVGIEPAIRYTCVDMYDASPKKFPLEYVVRSVMQGVPYPIFCHHDGAFAATLRLPVRTRHIRHYWSRLSWTRSIFVPFSDTGCSIGPAEEGGDGQALTDAVGN